MRNQMKQQDRVRKSSSRGRGGEDSAVEDGVASGFEIVTEASTRKHSHTTHSEKNSEIVDEEMYEDSDADEELPSNQQIISPIEVKDLIEKLWRKERDLLGLIYGKYQPVADGEPYVNDTLGAKMFFI
jgi:hypothetical protein